MDISKLIMMDEMPLMDLLLVLYESRRTKQGLHAFLYSDHSTAIIEPLGYIVDILVFDRSFIKA